MSEPEFTSIPSVIVTRALKARAIEELIVATRLKLHGLDELSATQELLIAILRDDLIAKAKTL